jgi:hypothetical protein
MEPLGVTDGDTAEGDTLAVTPDAVAEPVADGLPDTEGVADSGAPLGELDALGHVPPMQEALYVHVSV